MKTKSRRNLTRAVCMLQAFVSTWAVSYADCLAISSTKLATGTTSLLNDLSSWLLVLAPVVAVLVLIVNWLKQMIAGSEGEEQPHNKKTKTIFMILIAIECVSAIVKVVTSYYS